MFESLMMDIPWRPHGHWRKSEPLRTSCDACLIHGHVKTKNEDRPPLGEVSPPSSTVDASVQSADLMRMQMKSAFIDLHVTISKSFVDYSLICRLVFPRTSMDASKAFNLAVDALTLTQLGIYATDHGLIHQGRLRHQLAVRKLRDELVHAIKNEVYEESTMAAPFILFLCELFAPLANDGNGATQHLRGFAHMLLAHVTRTQPTQLYGMLMDDYQHFALVHAMTYRRRLPTAPETRANGPLPGRFPALTRLTMRLPGLLQDVDGFLRILDLDGRQLDEGLQVRSNRLFKDIERFEFDLLSWKSWFTTKHGSKTYRIVPSSTLLSFNSELDDASARVFPSAFVFTTLGECYVHFRFCSCLLAARMLYMRLQAVGFDTGTAALRCSQKDLTHLADNTCRMVIWLYSALVGTIGYSASMGPLRVAYQWYAYILDVEKMEWCEAAAGAMRARGLYMPELRPIT